jgi:flavorubredoxin
MFTSNIHEIAAGVYRIHTPWPVDAIPGGFSFNQYLLTGDQPLLFHTGSRRLFRSVLEAIERVMPVEKLRYVAFSHYEQDECGALNDFLEVARDAVPLCGMTNALINMDAMDRPPRVLLHGDTLDLGQHVMRWFDTPHLPHGWEAGYLHDIRTSTLLCGDLFTQPGLGEVALTTEDILGPSEGLRKNLDYYAHGPGIETQLEQLAACEPKTLACMHGSAWSGNGGELLRALSRCLRQRPERP